MLSSDADNIAVSFLAKKKKKKKKNLAASSLDGLLLCKLSIVFGHNIDLIELNIYNNIDLIELNI